MPKRIKLPIELLPFLCDCRLSDERLEIVIDRTEEIREVSITPVGTRWQGLKL